MSLTLTWLLLLLLFLCHHVNSGSIVEFLPGFEGPLPFKLETGYIGIGEKEEVQMFYYFIKSENNPQEDPLLVWLSGGPGCSSLYGLFFENGPVTLKIEPYGGNTPSLVSASYSWTKIANIIFLDQPIGSGFTYKRTPNINKSSDTIEVVRIYEFLHKWLGEHPEFLSNPFYVAGDSYAGKIVPALVQEISKGNYLCCKPLINLQGYVLGDPITDFELQRNHQIPYAHGMALISDELYESLKSSCNGDYENVDSHNTECLKLVGDYQKCVQKIYTLNILVSDCDQTSPDCYFYKYTLETLWANDERVHEALHVNKGSIREWIRCNRNIPYDMDIQSSVPYHINNSISGYRSLIYNGDHDMTVPFLSTQAWIRSLNYSIIDDWRPWMTNNQIAGYTRTYANKMTFATLKGCGHTADYKPNETFIMFQRWINGQAL